MSIWEGIALVIAIVAMNAVVAVVAYRAGRIDERWERVRNGEMERREKDESSTAF